MNDLIDLMEKIFESTTPVEKGLAIADGFGAVMCVLLFGFNLQNLIDGVFPSIILVLTAISLAISIVYKIVKWNWERTDRKENGSTYTD